jgi:hypothetical protein
MQMQNPPSKRTRADNQVTALAGEFFVAGELLKRGLQTSITFGNAKAFDIFAHSEHSGATYTVQVKTLRQRNYFLIKRSQIKPDHVYAFVILNKPGDAVEYFIVDGTTLSQAEGDLGQYLDSPKFPGIHWRALEPFRNNWQHFK